jgi:hypothetical protein
LPSPLPLPFLLSIAVYASSTIHGDMREEKFQNAAALEAWLIGKDVDEEDVAAAADKLFTKGFNKPSTLIGISSDDLNASGLTIPVAQTLSNKLKERQQQNGKLCCCSSVYFVFNLVLEYGNDSLFFYSSFCLVFEF